MSTCKSHTKEKLALAIQWNLVISIALGPIKVIPLNFISINCNNKIQCCKRQNTSDSLQRVDCGTPSYFAASICDITVSS